jgi:hypothetical protein
MIASTVSLPEMSCTQLLSGKACKTVRTFFTRGLTSELRTGTRCLIDSPLSQLSVLKSVVAPLPTRITIEASNSCGTSGSTESQLRLFYSFRMNVLNT